MLEPEHLEQILKSAPLVTSPSLSRFLRYIVEETLAGRDAAIREYTLGVNVFDRGEDFNPRLDPIVRVQARNLRARLVRYYEGPGADDPVRVELRKGTYVPLFHKYPYEPQPVEEAAQAAMPAEPAEPAAGPPSMMPAPPPRSPVAGPGGVPRYVIAVVILLVILIGIATVFLSQTQAAGQRGLPGVLAEDLYMRGRYGLDRETETSLRASVAAFEQAVARAPEYAAAHAGLADAYNLTAQFGMAAPHAAMEKARTEALHAIRLEPRLAEAHVALAAVIEAYDWNWKEAEREYRSALRLNPALPAAHLWYGMFLRDQGRMGEALPELRRAAQLQPYSVQTTINLAYALLEQGNAEAAMEQARRAVEMAPAQPTASLLQAYAAQALQRPDEVRTALEAAWKAANGNGHALAQVACALARSGRREEGLRVAGELNALSQRQYISPYDLGRVSLIMGDEDRAFQLFEDAYRERSSGLIFLRSVRGLVRDRPRFDSLVGRLRFQG